MLRVLVGGQLRFQSSEHEFSNDFIHGAPDVIDEVWMYVQTAFGRVTIGLEDGAGDSAGIYSPTVSDVNRLLKQFMEMQRNVIDRFNAGELDQKAAQLEIEHFWAGSLRRAVIDGDVERGSLMAGQSVGMVTREQTAQEIIDELVQQSVDYLAKRSAA